ncbi:malonate transporter subunit MadM [Haloferula sargassicola]|uniref:Malonate/sodium symporter MadM subunit N-terminal domain-containing protein n=1 Tax=Haloferula sargassicola TaxID=490096 RepID=A0ABP9UVL5_9BACT
MSQALEKLLADYALVTAFALVGGLMVLSYFISGKFTGRRIHGSAIAIFLGLVLAYLGGVATEGDHGLADIPALAGIGLMGGAMIRDLAIVSTAMGVSWRELREAGPGGLVALLLGVAISFFIGAVIGYLGGYRDAVSLATIGGGAATYIVGPVTGTALGASSEVIALSVAAGLVKSVLVMTATPFVARRIGLDNPRSAMVFGGLLGTTSGVAGGLAATDPKLVPYGAMTATFYTGIGCLVGPSIVYFVLRALV